MQLGSLDSSFNESAIEFAREDGVRSSLVRMGAGASGEVASDMGAPRVAVQVRPACNIYIYIYIYIYTYIVLNETFTLNPGRFDRQIKIDRVCGALHGHGHVPKGGNVYVHMCVVDTRQKLKVIFNVCVCMCMHVCVCV